MDIIKFIEEEKMYFKPMLERQNFYSETCLKNFRKETLAQRKERISIELYEYCNGIVRYGPFSGLKLSKNPWWGKSDLGSMCLGLYEEEVLNVFFSGKFHGRKTLIDIGAADGYYAIGLLKSKKVEKAICYELSQIGQDTILSNWKLNCEPGEIEINGDVFENFIHKNSSLDFSECIAIVDIEGAEFSFLNNDVLAFMKKSYILIEIHNWVPDFITKYSSFLLDANKYFDIEILERTDRNTMKFQELRSFTDDNRLLVTSESRPCSMRFLLLSPKNMK
jgi:hypothetical protein